MSSSTYDRYYSASDTQLVISDISSERLLTLDLATGIGFNESAPLQPIYGLNNTTPSFFVRQNSIVTGFIGLAYKYESYLKKSIMHVNGLSPDTTLTKVSTEISDFDTLKKAIAERNLGELNDKSSSLTISQFPFNLTIIISTDNIDGEFESVTLNECYITGRSLAINVDGESALSEGFSIICPSIR
jgi:hypothetical protein